VLPAAAFGFAAAGEAAVVLGSYSGAPAFEPTIWYSIDKSGLVTVNVIRAEMGQHVGTAIARIVADELEADWDKVRIVHVDSDPKWGLMVTGGSWSVWQSYALMSQAGAAGRVALIAAGAKLLGVDPKTCQARKGAVISGKRSVSYGDIIAKGGLKTGFTEAELKALPIKTVSERRMIGRDVQAKDIPQKTDGSGIYGLDATAPGMVYARPKIPPTRNESKVVSVDETAAKAVPGYQGHLVLDDPSNTVPGWVVVLGDSFVAANRAARALKVEWTSGPTAKVSDADLRARAEQLIADPKAGSTVLNDPGVDAAFGAAKSTLSATYTTDAALHFQMEPLNALAFERNGVFEIHTGNQWQSLILPTLAKALGRPEDRIVLKTYLLGGGFGRRLNGDYAVPAALASKALGKPVKLVFTREDDTAFDSFRSPSVQLVKMAFGEGGQVTAMDHSAAAGWPTEVMAPFFMPKGTNDVPYDPFAISGANHWYSVGAHRVRAISNDLANRAFRPGWLRSVGPGWTNWAVESAMDEAAHQLGVSPSPSASSCWTPRAVTAAQPMAAARSAAPNARPPSSPGPPSWQAMAASCRPIPALALPLPLARSGTCPPGRPAPPGSMWIARPAR